MFMYILPGLLMYFMYRLDGHTIIYNRAVRDYSRFKALNSLVATHHKNIGLILWFSMCIIVKAMYINLIQYLNKSMRKIDKNHYELSYVVNGNLYKMFIRIRRGPRNIIQALDGDDCDITDMIQEYGGCSEDFHGYPLTPCALGKNSVTLYLSSGDEKIFGLCDVISIA